VKIGAAANDETLYVAWSTAAAGETGGGTHEREIIGESEETRYHLRLRDGHRVDGKLGYSRNGSSYDSTCRQKMQRLTTAWNVVRRSHCDGVRSTRLPANASIVSTRTQHDYLTPGQGVNIAFIAPPPTVQVTT